MMKLITPLGVSLLISLSACGAGGGADSAVADPAGASDTVAQASVKDTATSRTTATTTTTTTTAAAAVVNRTVPVGRLLASNCFNCHGTDGHSSGGFDSLAGESAQEIYSEMKEMQRSTESEKAIMRIHALGYSDDQIWQLAGYFAQQKR